MAERGMRGRCLDVLKEHPFEELSIEQVADILGVKREDAHRGLYSLMMAGIVMRRYADEPNERGNEYKVYRLDPSHV